VTAVITNGVHRGAINVAESRRGQEPVQVREM